MKDIWIQRYYPEFEKLLERCFKFKTFQFPFSRIDQFEDPLEAWDIKSSSIFKQAYQIYMQFGNRVLGEDGGKIEGNRSTFKQIVKLLDIWVDENDIDDIYDQILAYKKYITSTYASCWFMAENELKEERYMWSLYGKNSPNSVIVSINLTEVLNSLPIEKLKIEKDKIEYKDKIDSFNVFEKHASYYHEKEYRFVTNKIDNSEEFHNVKVDLNKITLILNPHISKEKEDLIRSKVTSNVKITRSQLPPTFSLKNINKIFN